MSLESIIKEINKKYDFTMVTKGIKEDHVTKVPFSSPRLNYMLYGGLPVGRIVEFSGAEGSGKTTTALDAVKNFQKTFPDKSVLFIDCERTFDVSWAKTLGVDVESLLVVQPEEQSAEEIFEIILNLISSGDISLAVLDSLAVMVSAQAYDKSMEEKTYGGISQSLTLFSRKLIPILSRTNCTFIGINQVRENMNSPYGGTITPGGKAWKHNCTLRLEFKRGDFYDEKGNRVSQSFENPAGNIINCNIIKNKVNRSDRKNGFYSLNYITGIDYVSDTIDLALKYKLISQAGAWYEITDQIVEGGMKLQGKKSVKTALISNPEIYEVLNETLKEAIE